MRPGLLALARLETQHARFGHRFAVEIGEQGRRRLVVRNIGARIDIAVAGAMLERDAPLPARRAPGRSRIGMKVRRARRRHRRRAVARQPRSEEHTSELQSLMRNSYAVFCSKKKKKK